MKIDPKEFSKIAEMIACAESPVGIDAKKTHVYIIHLLQHIERRVKQIEDRLTRLEESTHLKL
jgi:hypothetical protein